MKEDKKSTNIDIKKILNKIVKFLKKTLYCIKKGFSLLVTKIKEISKKIYINFSFKGVVRIDFFIVNGQVLVNEINTVPGSLAYYLFSDTLKGLSNMLDQLIATAEKDYAKSLTVQKSYNSGILAISGGKGAKRL